MKPAEDTIYPANEVKGTRLILIHTAVCLFTFLVGQDPNMIATAVPVITDHYNSIADEGWYGSAFMLALYVHPPPPSPQTRASLTAGGQDLLFPKKLVYLAYVAVLEVGSLVCALAPSSKALIVGRAVAELGASGIFAGGFVVVTTMIPLHRRATYTGTVSAVFAVASHATWRWCYYINLPVGGFAAALFVPFFHIRPPATEKAPLRNKLKGLDILGFVLFAGSNSSVIIGLFWQLYMQDDALIPPRLFSTHRNVALICGSSFFVNGPFQVIVIWLPIWFQAALGALPTQNRINYFPTVIAIGISAAFIGAGVIVQAVWWWNSFLLLAEALVCIGGSLLSTIDPGISAGHWLGYQILAGFGFSLAGNLAHLGMQVSLPMELVPLGATNLLAGISTSCAVFVAIGQAVFQKRLVSNLSAIVSSDTVNKIISAGATNLQSVLDPAVLPGVIRQYGKSVTEVFVS
ncbi:MFS general substrate transporter [Xylariaceae sp. FL0662B]|nr:MFS general substrate transporter [Xylariaceae sp. FL0662B]